MRASLYLVSATAWLFISCAASPAKVTDQQGPLNLSFSKMAVYNEEDCLKAGGVCVEKDECPEGKLAEETGLCPEQQKRGVECCHGLPRSLKHCQGLGGHCTSSCPDNLKITQAEDCAAPQICCTLVA